MCRVLLCFIAGDVDLQDALAASAKARCDEVVDKILTNAKTCDASDNKALTSGVSVRDMKLTMVALDVSHADCVEKHELVEVPISFFDVFVIVVVIVAIIVAIIIVVIVVDLFILFGY